MRQRVSVQEASGNLEGLVEALNGTDEVEIVDDAGNLKAVMTSPEAYRQMVHDRFWATVDRIRERNADKDPDEVYRNVTEIVEEVRRERNEARQRELTHSRS